MKTSSCFTCHFTNENFNTGTGRCQLCHTLPTGKIPVHGGELSKEEKAKVEAANANRITHEVMQDHNVNCIACHANVATENSTVSQRDCEHCHDDPKSKYFDPVAVASFTGPGQALPRLPRTRAACQVPGLPFGDPSPIGAWQDRARPDWVPGIGDDQLLARAIRISMPPRLTC